MLFAIFELPFEKNTFIFWSNILCFGDIMAQNYTPETALRKIKDELLVSAQDLLLNVRKTALQKLDEKEAKEFSDALMLIGHSLDVCYYGLGEKPK